MTKPTTNHLRLHREPAPAASGDLLTAPGGERDVLASLCHDFHDVTGWALRYSPNDVPLGWPDLLWSSPLNLGTGDAPGYLILGSESPQRESDVRRANLAATKRLASGLVDVLDELGTARRALWQREAELAAGVPIIACGDQSQHLAVRLEAVLKAGAQTVDCQAAGLYLLDAATTELKLRSCWGLPSSRLTRPARALSGALADLEALTGHAVVLTDDLLVDHWNVPERFASAVCVPVSGPSMVLGTLWMYCTEPRDFDDQQTNQIEIIAGRLAVELEREMLLTEGAETQGIRRQLDDAERLQRNQSPQVAPQLDGWQVAGWTRQAQSLGGDFFDWSVLADGNLAITVGDALDEGAAAALVAASLRTAIRVHAEYQPTAGEVLEAANRSLYAASVGDQFASALFARIEPESGQMQLAAAGRVGAMLLCDGSCEVLTREGMPLALHPDSKYPSLELAIEAGAVLVVVTDGVSDAVDSFGTPLDENTLAATLLPHLDLSAESLAELIRDQLDSHASTPQDHDCTVLVVRRK